MAAPTTEGPHPRRVAARCTALCGILAIAARVIVGWPAQPGPSAHAPSGNFALPSVRNPARLGPAVAADPLSPPPAVEMASAYDAADAEVVMFGGLGAWPSDQFTLATTWAYAGGNIAGSVALCLLAVWAGQGLGSSLNAMKWI